MAEDGITLETPKWLEALENKRNRPRKLAHDIGAGAPCLVCKDGCKGLNLHFWRKICMECKCRKEDHDIQDEDDCASFEILFGTKNVKRTTLKFNKQAKSFDWVPPNVTPDLAEDYLNALPKEKLPISNSEGAKYRKHQLEKQLPLHDVDPTACHNLTPEEKELLEKYLENLRKNVIGQGQVFRYQPRRASGNLIHDQISLQTSVSEEQRKNPALSTAGVPRPIGSYLVKTQPPIDKPESESVNSETYSVPSRLHSSVLPHQHITLEALQRQQDQSQPLHRPHPNVGQLTGGKVPSSLTSSVNVNQQTGRAELLGPFEEFSDNSPALFSQEAINKLDKQYIPSYLSSSNNSQYKTPGQVQTLGKLHKSSTPADFNSTEYVSKGTTGSLDQLETSNMPGQVETMGKLQRNSVPANMTSTEYAQRGIQGSLGQLHSPSKNYSPGEIQKGVPGIHGNRYQDSMQSQGSTLGSHPNQNELNSILSKNMVPSYLTSSNDVESHHATSGLYPGSTPLHGGFIGNQPIGHNQNELNSTLNKQAGPPYLSSASDINSQRGTSGILQDNRYPNNMPLQGGFIGNQPIGNNQNELNGTHNKQAVPPYDINSQRCMSGMLQDGRYPDNMPLQGSFIGNQPIGHEQNEVTSRLSKQSVPSYIGLSNDVNLQRGLTSSVPYGQSHDNKIEKEGNLVKNYVPNYQQLDGNLGAPKPFYLRTPNQFIPHNMDPNFYDTKNNNIYPVENKPHTDIENHMNSMNQQYIPSQLNSTLVSANNPYSSAEVENVPYSIVQESANIISKPVPQQTAPLIQNKEIDPENLTDTYPEPPLMCAQCCIVLNEGDIVVTTERGGQTSLWHARCFVCDTCNELLVDLLYFFHKGKVYCGRHFAEKTNIPRCAACDELIFVKEYTCAEGAAYHVRHFCCFHCDQPLGGKNYIPSDDNQPYCLDCYQLKFGKCCKTCNIQIQAGEERVTWKDLHFHVTDVCFKCTCCHKSLLGGKFVVNKNNIFCNKQCVNNYSS